MQGSGRGLIWGGRSFCQSFSTWSARCEDKYCPVDVYFQYWLLYGTTVIVIITVCWHVLTLSLVDRCLQSLWLICQYLHSHCHHNLTSHTVFIFSFVSEMCIKMFLYENQWSRIKYRVFCMFGGSSNCVWARNLSFKCDELPSCRWNWIWISSCEFVCVCVCVSMCIVYGHHACDCVRQLLEN